VDKTADNNKLRKVRVRSYHYLLYIHVLHLPAIFGGNAKHRISQGWNKTGHILENIWVHQIPMH